ncbi:hypothetical protein KRR26_29840 [Corallococcus sp. M34]|uniref:hypothetical protein n=1 Tax=Citreicoccus inhibens TaxID=2849499 RepID=UPI001C21FE19|nr:hypothetical protein [Citreicoccus inhibens]MBU8899820.1 hypothetical protein [Citreicoccus inhibens]
MALSVYAPSHRLGQRMPVLVPVLLLCTVLLGALYQPLLYVLPLQILQFVLPCALGAVVGALSAGVISRAPCRSPPFAWGLIVVAALVAWVASWASTLALDLREAYPDASWDLLLSSLTPDFVSEWISARNAAGWVDSKGKTTQGVFVTIVWVVEPIVMMGTAVFAGREAARRLFCEPCHRWLDTRSLSAHGLNATDVKPLIDAGDLRSLVELSSDELMGTNFRISVSRHRCTTCNQSTYLSIEEVRVMNTRYGPQDRRKSLLRNVVLPAALDRRFDERLAELEGAPSRAA